MDRGGWLEQPFPQRDVEPQANKGLPAEGHSREQEGGGAGSACALITLS